MINSDRMKMGVNISSTNPVSLYNPGLPLGSPTKSSKWYKILENVASVQAANITTYTNLNMESLCQDKTLS